MSGKRLTEILRKQEQVADGFPYSQVGFPGYDNREINTFEQMNIIEEDLIDIHSECFDYTYIRFPYEHPNVDMKKAKQFLKF